MFVYHHKAYDDLKVYRGVKRTYRANNAVAFTFTAGTGVFFSLVGSATKTVRVQRLTLSGLTLTAVAYNTILLTKTNGTATSGGTKLGSANLTVTKADSSHDAATATAACYTAGATAGATPFGIVSSRRVLLQANTAAAAGIPETHVFDWRNVGEADGVVLRGVTQCLEATFLAAPATDVLMNVEVEWTESSE